MSESGQPSLKTDLQSRAVKSESMKTSPRCRHAHLFESFLGILLLNPRFFFHHLVQHGPFDILKTPVHSFENGDLLEAFIGSFSLLMPILNKSEHTNS